MVIRGTFSALVLSDSITWGSGSIQIYQSTKFFLVTYHVLLTQKMWSFIIHNNFANADQGGRERKGERQEREREGRNGTNQV